MELKGPRSDVVKSSGFFQMCNDWIWGTYVEIRGHPMKQKTNRGLFLFERTVGGPGYT